MKPEIHSKAVSKGIMWGSLLWRLPVGTGNTRAINVLFGRVCSQLNNHILIQSTATTLSGQLLHVPTRLFAQKLFLSFVNSSWKLFLKKKLLLVCYSVRSSENESYTEISLVHHSKNIGTSESIEKVMKPLRENENPTA
jgi:hypothetical protein